MSGEVDVDPQGDGCFGLAMLFVVVLFLGVLLGWWLYAPGGR